MKTLREEIRQIIIGARANAIGGNDNWDVESINYYLNRIIEAVKERDAYVLREGDRDFMYDASDKKNLIIIDMVIEKERHLYCKRQEETL
jgi:hypothetical protein